MALTKIDPRIWSAVVYDEVVKVQHVDIFEFLILPLNFFSDEEDKDGPKLDYDQPELIVLRKTCNLKD